MPEIGDQIHLSMLQSEQSPGIYGLQWGDPNVRPDVRSVRDRFVRPYLHFDHTALEIGPGGGRWTRYLLSFREVYAVDYHQELLDELAKEFRAPHLHLIKNNGWDFPGVPDSCIDFLFTFGVFVHIELPDIKRYIDSMRRLLKPTANVVIQYSDMTKDLSKKLVPGWADNDPMRMRAAVLDAGYQILEEDMETMSHSSIVRFRPH